MLPYTSVMKLPILVSAIAMVALALGQSQSTPKETVAAFLKDLREAKVEEAGKLVYHANLAPGLKQMAKEFAGIPKVTITGEKIIGDKATVSMAYEAGTTTTKPSTASLTKVEGKWYLSGGDTSSKTNLDEFDGLVRLFQSPALFAESIQGAKSAAQSTVCLSNVRQLSTAVIIYLSDHDDKFFGNVAKFQGEIAPYAKHKELFACPVTHKPYSFNKNLVGKSDATIEAPAQTVMVYEGANGKLDFIHNGKAVVGFCDGHVKMISKIDASKLRWK